MILNTATEYGSTLELYNYGDECTAVTGGWEKPSGLTYVASDLTYSNTGTMTKNASNIYLNALSGKIMACACTVNKLNCFGLYTNLNITYTHSNSGNGRLYVVSANTGDVVANALATLSLPSGTEATLTVSIGSLTSGYIAPFAINQRALTVHRIWLSK